VSPVEVVDLVLARIEAMQPDDQCLHYDLRRLGLKAAG
jgi:hypothetical protein